MALGKNMKVDRLIPSKKVDVQSETEQAETPLSVSLDEFFGESSTSAPEPEEIEVENVVSAEIEPVESKTVVEEIKTEAAPATPFEDVDEETIKIVFTPSRRKTQKRILISIEGNLTIRNVELLYSKVNAVFENYDFVEVTLTNVTEIDLSVVQLFHTIRVTYYPQQKFIAINAEFSRNDRKLLNTCGFTEFQTQKTA